VQPEGGGHLFFAGDHRLEGILEWPGEGAPSGDDTRPEGSAVRGGVVLAHPHSLAGGTMAQPVVYRVARGCRERGLATLRFNFRGVGRSGGAFSGTEEYRDVEAAAAYLRGRLASAVGGDPSGSRTLPLALAGYSFGSVMVARAAAGPIPIQALALIGFVVSWPELPADTLDRLGRFRGPVLAVCAENDELGRPEDVDHALRKLGLDYSLQVVEGAGHFLEGRHREVGEAVAEFLSSRLRLRRFGGE
jgi:alpha/beta superfamily hydrolase